MNLGRLIRAGFLLAARCCLFAVVTSTLTVFVNVISHCPEHIVKPYKLALFSVYWSIGILLAFRPGRSEETLSEFIIKKSSSERRAKMIPMLVYLPPGFYVFAFLVFYVFSFLGPALSILAVYISLTQCGL